MRCVCRRFYHSEHLRVKLESKRDVALHFYGKDWRGKLAQHRSTLATIAEQHGVVEDTLMQELSSSITASLVASDAKDEERCIVTVSGEHREVYAEAIPALGEVRGFLREGVRELLPSTITMNRVLYNASKPVYSVVQGRDVGELLWRGGMATKLWLGGGLVLEPAPVSDKAPSVTAREELQARLDGLSALEDGELPSEYVKRVFPDMRKSSLKRVWIAFNCRCSKQLFLSYLKSFPKQELVDMQEQNHRELSCHFCNRICKLSDEDFQSLLLTA